MAQGVILYRTVSCPWCHKTAEFLQEHKIKFKDVYVDKDEKAAEEMVKLSGQRGVPVIDIDGKIIVGFDVPALKKTLKIK